VNNFDAHLIGQLVLDRYRIVRPLGQGGMGVVYLGRIEGAAGFARPIVIKRMSPEMGGDQSAADLFIREARILSNLQHPAIVGVVDFGREGDSYVMVLEYVHGFHLGQWLRYLRSEGRAMPSDWSIHIVVRVLDALHYAHTFARADGTPLRIVHRDVSPANILLDAQGYIKLADFGIARVLGESGEYKTQDGTFKGKLPYTPPEIYRGEAPSPSSDVYACGVVLYELLAGQNPFRGKELSETVQKVIAHVPPPLNALRDDLPPEIDELLALALSKSPDARPQSARTFADALRSLRTRSEEDIAAEMSTALREDFSALPLKLRLETLEERDAAWRRAQGGRVPADVRGALSSTPPGVLDVTTRDAVTPAAALILNDRISTTGGNVASVLTAHESPKPARTGALIAVLASVAAAGAAAAGVAVYLSTQQPRNDQPRFLVVERGAEQSAPGQQPSSQPAQAERADLPATPLAALPEENPPHETPSGSEPKRPLAAVPQPPSPAALSKTFSRKQGAVRACFESHTVDLSGQPQISVRFQVDTAGKVTRAELIPASLQGTALGGCILNIARSTQFGPLTEPITFTIPITARVAQ
jgi:serine/threonine-protein kinase